MIFDLIKAKSANELKTWITEHPEDVHLKTNFGGYNTLQVAIIYNSEHCVELLLDAGVSVLDKSKGLWSALHYAASTGNLTIIKRLVELGVSLNDRTEEGLTPLECAVNHSKKEAEVFLKEVSQAMSEQAIFQKITSSMKADSEDQAKKSKNVVRRI